MSRLLLVRTLGASEVRRRLDRLLELIGAASGSPRDTVLELLLSDEESVGLVKLSHDDSEDMRERCRREEEDDAVRVRLEGSAEA